MSDKFDIARRAMLRRELVHWQTKSDVLRHSLDRALARATYYRGQLETLRNDPEVPSVLEAAE